MQKGAPKHVAIGVSQMEIVADIGAEHGRKWRFKWCGEWLIALSEYVGEAGNVGKV
jgi:hypothetical protein